jgi:Ni/Fe-hydrogenase 1 B-type cytochrome subunit
MSTIGTTIVPTYVWEVPVRVWHWVMAGCMVVLCITGYLIGLPLPSVGGEASEHFQFGYVRFAHFAAALVFSVVFVWRVVWAFVGNTYAREIFTVPLQMLSGTWWRGLFEQIQHYAFVRGEVRPWLGHNPLAVSAKFFIYVLGSVFMICTGLAMYGQDLGINSWVFSAFTSWVMPLCGDNSQNLHTLHRLGMWNLVAFTIVHVYMVVREDICSGETIISTMINGWRISKK